MGEIVTFFNQIKYQGDNFTYIMADSELKEAIVIDSSFNAEIISKIILEHKFILRYILCTHHHSDHTAGNKFLKKRFNCQIVAHKTSRINKDVQVKDKGYLSIGNIPIKIIYTPGHTPDSISILIRNRLFSGDTLFVGECGRTDLPGGSSVDLYQSLFNKLLKLNDDIKVYPGHDYGPTQFSTIGHEKLTNYTLKDRSIKEFIAFMKEP